MPSNTSSLRPISPPRARIPGQCRQPESTVTTNNATTSPTYPLKTTEPSYKSINEPIPTSTGSSFLLSPQLRRLAEGNSHYKLGPSFYPTAQLAFAESAHVARGANDLFTEGIALRNMGVLMTANRNLSSAHEFSKQGLTLAQALKDPIGEVAALINIGVAFHHAQDFQESLHNFRKALLLSRNSGDIKGESMSLWNLASCHFTTGKLVEAIEYYESCRQVMQRLGDPIGEYLCSLSMGASYAKLGRLYRAIQLFGDALEISTRSGHKDAQISCLLHLGAAHSVLGDTSRTQRFKTELECLLQSHSNTDIAIRSLTNRPNCTTPLRT